jgi:hypothetical protein
MGQSVQIYVTVTISWRRPRGQEGSGTPTVRRRYFREPKRSALRFAELFATNHLAIDDSVYEELREQFSEDELVEVGLHCAIALGVGRLSATWDVSDNLPDTNGGPERLAPWNSASVIASG